MASPVLDDAGKKRPPRAFLGHLALIGREGDPGARASPLFKLRRDAGALLRKLRGVRGLRWIGERHQLRVFVVFHRRPLERRHDDKNIVKVEQH